MTTTQNAPTTTGFPAPSTALEFGWSFLKANVWLVLVVGLISGLLVGWTVAVWTNTYHDSSASLGKWLAALAVWAVNYLLQSVLKLVMCRRAFDYRQETEGHVAPRSFSIGLRQAINGAMPRVLPYVGWSLFQLSLVTLVFVLWFVIATAASDGVAIVLLLALAVALVAVELFTAFYDLAAADGPGNPLTRSAQVFKGRFWSVVKVILAFVLIALAIAAPIGLVVMAVARDSFGDATSAVINSGVYTVVGLAIGLGARVAMYRSAFPAGPSR